MTSFFGRVSRCRSAPYFPRQRQMSYHVGHLIDSNQLIAFFMATEMSSVLKALLKFSVVKIAYTALFWSIKMKQMKREAPKYSIIYYTLSRHRRRHRGAEGAVAPWIFIHGTDKVEGGLMVLFFGLVFSAAPPSGNFSANALVWGQINA